MPVHLERGRFCDKVAYLFKKEKKWLLIKNTIFTYNYLQLPPPAYIVHMPPAYESISWLVSTWIMLQIWGINIQIMPKRDFMKKKHAKFFFPFFPIVDALIFFFRAEFFFFTPFVPVTTCDRLKVWQKVKNRPGTTYERIELVLEWSKMLLNTMFLYNSNLH